MNLLRNKLGAYFLVNSMESNDKNSYFHKWWNGESWCEIFAEYFEANWKHKKIKEIKVLPEKKITLCEVGETEKEYFLLVSYNYSDTPDRIFFIGNCIPGNIEENYQEYI